MSTIVEMKEAFREFARKKALKSTQQRELILDIFFREGGHISIDELLERVRRKNARIGHATVYRTLKLLCEAGLADERRFGAGLALYERADATHHDHLICSECGRIEEFENEAIEKLQEEVASRHSFSITDHKHEIYGICSTCREKKQ